MLAMLVSSSVDRMARDAPRISRDDRMRLSVGELFRTMAIG
jgi:hypothetical protein